jgi:hypothetical protein
MDRGSEIHRLTASLSLEAVEQHRRRHLHRHRHRLRHHHRQLLSPVPLVSSLSAPLRWRCKRRGWVSGAFMRGAGLPACVRVCACEKGVCV